MPKPRLSVDVTYRSPHACDEAQFAFSGGSAALRSPSPLQRGCGVGSGGASRLPTRQHSFILERTASMGGLQSGRSHATDANVIQVPPCHLPPTPHLATMLHRGIHSPNASQTSSCSSTPVDRGALIDLGQHGEILQPNVVTLTHAQRSTNDTGTAVRGDVSSMIVNSPPQAAYTLQRSPLPRVWSLASEEPPGGSPLPKHLVLGTTTNASGAATRILLVDDEDETPPLYFNEDE
jgi:hypothetical protein